MPLTHEEFETAVRVYGPRIRRLLRGQLPGREQDADDLLQRTFERAWAKRESRIDSLLPWLIGIARQEFLTHLRGSARYTRLKEAIQENPLELPPIEGPSSSRDEEVLARCLERLESLDRQIVDLFYGRPAVHGATHGIGQETVYATGRLSDPEIARELSRAHAAEWRPERLRMRRHRALSQLRICVERSSSHLATDQTSSSPEVTHV
jgi:RNA polymerase sigma factor (sigma-70 family)